MSKISKIEDIAWRITNRVLLQEHRNLRVEPRVRTDIQSQVDR